MSDINTSNTNMSEFICQFCNKKFSTKYTLATHQKTSRKCLETQNKVDIIYHECEYCDYKSTNKWNLGKHTETCNKKEKTEDNKKINDDLKLENSRLKIKIEVLL